MKIWTPKEEQYLIENYDKTPSVVLCDHFSISKGTLAKKKRQLGLVKKPKWDIEKEEYLLKNHKLQTLVELARELDVSVSLIRQKKFQLGLTRALKKNKWPKEAIYNEINNLFFNSADISASNVKKAYPSLYSMARNYYKTWRGAIKACGLDYEQIRKNTANLSWTKKKVIEQIQLLHHEKADLSSKYNCRKQKKLWNAANVYFFSWRNAVEEANINYDKHSKNILNWTPQKIREEITKLHKNELPLFASYAKKNYVRLYGAARSHFADWKEAIEFCGLDYEQINQRANEVDWSPSLIKEMLLELNEKEEDLSEGVVLRKYPGLRTAAKRLFGNWSNAITYSGLDIDQIRKDINTEAYKGRLFEEIVYDILLATGRKVTRNNHTKINKKIYIPDFIDKKTDLWIDAKLSSWGASVEKSINKYLEVQDNLEIIFLKSGPRFMSNVNFVSVDSYFDRLKQIGRLDLIERINSL
ncbi:MAG: hypothetical protein KKB05_01920 [Proteobacteria bacterium]|nr:hypothetical protein [Pseudomonadota bacterium]MBU4462685.1 hypothetical protein [Pseudomonadota bacterium]